MGRPYQPPEAGRREGGFTYLAMLLLVVTTSTGAVAVSTLWHTAERREQERELLAAGDELRRAIASYHTQSPGGRRQYPRRLEDLLLDPRFPGIRRHLRRILVDPVSGKAEWGLVKAPDGGIMGVHSLSGAVPLKTAGFAPAHRFFEGTSSYRQWEFVYREPIGTVPAPMGWTARPAPPQQ